MKFDGRKALRVRMDHKQAVKLMGSDGTWRRSCVLLDVSQSKPKEDYQSDRLAQGKWDWSFTVGGASLKIPSVFDGERIGDAQ